jgi:hypothetical protein
MSMMKYIVVAGSHGIVFDPILQHKDVAPAKWPATGAGFCMIGEDGVPSCYGGSVSMRIESKPEDEAIIEALLRRE